MPLISRSDRSFVESISALANCNPFLPERIKLERAALGSDFVADKADWNRHIESAGEHPNIDRLLERAERVARELRKQLSGGESATAEELERYEELVLFLLYHKSRGGFDLARSSRERVRGYAEFRREADVFFASTPLAKTVDLTHAFACCFQVRRAFHHIFTNIVGSSDAVAQLRAAIWQSIFTHDLRRYRRVLYDRMADLTTLVTGPSGTGKELVARAIAHARYVPFNEPQQRFESPDGEIFFALNVSALAPTLVESELFGHRRGAFTGAMQDRPGWLELCPAVGSVFLDEVGDIEIAVQVKLLRVLQARTFQRLGESTARRFKGKIIAATNRDLGEEIAGGRFRADFYYRLCSDLVRTPSLHEQLGESAEELQVLVQFIVEYIVGAEEAQRITAETVAWIEKHLGSHYAWPGN
ncbi:MAG TPA: sigma-54 factor interaction domain-containing protein, partial [Methylomirabilota bacterium]|nr:sigma-54 factor interaction domain-containing protein [Methylomirabilota bacterium]